MNNATIQHGDAQAAKEAFLQQYKSAYESGRWMAVTVRVGPDGTLTLSRTTFNFPTDQFDPAMDLLRRELDKDRGGQRPARLPLAPHIVQSFVDNIPQNGHALDLLPDDVLGVVRGLEQEGDDGVVL